MSKSIWSLRYNGKIIYTNTDKPTCPSQIILRYWPNIDQALLSGLQPGYPIEDADTNQKLEWTAYQG